ncbi:Adenylate cyclase [Diplonema papillatum]|nr:Adenylate cyclase [Diplonema papillatum]
MWAWRLEETAAASFVPTAANGGIPVPHGNNSDDSRTTRTASVATISSAEHSPSRRASARSIEDNGDLCKELLRSKDEQLTLVLKREKATVDRLRNRVKDLELRLNGTSGKGEEWQSRVKKEQDVQLHTLQAAQAKLIAEFSKQMGRDPGLDMQMFVASNTPTPMKQEGDAELAPTDEVTLVFTDVQNSTHLWDQATADMMRCLQIHNGLMRDLIKLHKGYEVKTEGDAFMVAFFEPYNAVAWALDVQVKLMECDWPSRITEFDDANTVLTPAGAKLWHGLRVRIGIHVGSPECIPDQLTRRMDYFGPMVNTGARVAGCAQGGEIVCSANVFNRLRNLDSLAMTSLSLGEKKFKGVSTAVQCYRLIPDSVRIRVFASRKPPLPEPSQQSYQQNPMAPVRCNSNASNAGSTEAGSEADNQGEGTSSFLDWVVREERKRDEEPPEGTISLVFTDVQGSTHLWDCYETDMRAALAKHNALMRCLIKVHNGYEVKTEGDAFMVAFSSTESAVAFVGEVQLRLLVVDWPAGILKDADASHVADSNGRLLWNGLRVHNGYEVKTEGDAFMVAFSSTESAVAFVGEAQLRLLVVDWPAGILKDADASHVADSNGRLLWNGLRVRMGIHRGRPEAQRDPVTKRMDYLGPVVNVAARVAAHGAGGEIVISKTVVDAVSAKCFQKNDAAIESLGGKEFKGVSQAVEVYRLTPRPLLGRKFKPSPPKQPTMAELSEKLLKEQQAAGMASTKPPKNNTMPVKVADLQRLSDTWADIMEFLDRLTDTQARQFKEQKERKEIIQGRRLSRNSDSGSKKKITRKQSVFAVQPQPPLVQPGTGRRKSFIGALGVDPPMPQPPPPPERKDVEVADVKRITREMESINMFLGAQNEPALRKVFCGEKDVRYVVAFGSTVEVPVSKSRVRRASKDKGDGGPESRRSSDQYPQARRGSNRSSIDDAFKSRSPSPTVFGGRAAGSISPNGGDNTPAGTPGSPPLPLSARPPKSSTSAASPRKAVLHQPPLSDSEGGGTPHRQRKWSTDSPYGEREIRTVLKSNSPRARGTGSPRTASVILGPRDDGSPPPVPQPPHDRIDVERGPRRVSIGSVTNIQRPKAQPPVDANPHSSPLRRTSSAFASDRMQKGRLPSLNAVGEPIHTHPTVRKGIPNG